MKKRLQTDRTSSSLFPLHPGCRVPEKQHAYATVSEVYRPPKCHTGGFVDGLAQRWMRAAGRPC